MILLLFAALAMQAQTFDAVPRMIPQGNTLRIHSDFACSTARMNGRSVPLFASPESGGTGLMAIPVLEPPGEYLLECISAAGVSLAKLDISIRDAHFPQQNLIIAKELSELKPSDGENETVSAFRKTVSPERLWQEPLQLPVNGCLTSLFGVSRLHNGKLTGDFHSGVDQRGAAGSPVRSVAAGVVKIVRPFQLRGGTVAIDHGQGVQSLYLHMSAFSVKEGDRVTAGAPIGFVGSTGRSTAPHLHWTLYVNGLPVNPSQWMTLQPCSPARKAAPKTRKNVKRRV